jgi:hypothetical protein
MDVMHVKISAIEFEVKNTLPGVKDMVARIDETMQELKARFNHLIIDGVVVTDTPFDYVKQNRKNIKEVEVIFVAECQKPQKAKSVKVRTRAKTGPIKVTISNIEFEVKRTLSGVNNMFSQIEESMKDFHVYFSHLVVDGIEVNDALREYLEQHLGSIDNIEVSFLTAEQYLHQVVTIMDCFLEKAIPAIKEVANEFYAKPDDGTWERFNVAASGMQGMINIVSEVVGDKALNVNIKEFDQLGTKLAQDLTALMEAVERNDMTAVGDVLRYEVAPFFESLHIKISKTARENRDGNH